MVRFGCGPGCDDTEDVPKTVLRLELLLRKANTEFFMDHAEQFHSIHAIQAKLVKVNVLAQAHGELGQAKLEALKYLLSIHWANGA